MNLASFEEIRKKYRMAKREESNIDILLLKLEIEGYIRNLRASSEENEDLLAEAQDMFIEVIRMIEESHCRPSKLC